MANCVTLAQARGPARLKPCRGAPGLRAVRWMGLLAEGEPLLRSGGGGGNAVPPADWICAAAGRGNKVSCGRRATKPRPCQGRKKFCPVSAPDRIFLREWPSASLDKAVISWPIGDEQGWLASLANRLLFILRTGRERNTTRPSWPAGCRVELCYNQAAHGPNRGRLPCLRR